MGNSFNENRTIMECKLVYSVDAGIGQIPYENRTIMECKWLSTATDATVLTQMKIEP